MEIGNWYWLFHQTILFYGTAADQNITMITLYHGLSHKVCFTNFRPSFACPISTTTSFDVAQQLGNIGGVIMQIQPMKSSPDRWMDVTWISCFKEGEILFCRAHYLEIIDVRFVDEFIGFTVHHSHKTILSAIRLFDNIFINNCSYNSQLLDDPQTQNMLMKLLKYETFLDEIADVIDSEKYKLLDSEEYDSDAIFYDSKDLD
eukprot:96124_1